MPKKPTKSKQTFPTERWLVKHHEDYIGRFYLADGAYPFWLVTCLCNAGDCFKRGTVLCTDTYQGLPVYWCQEHAP